MSAHVHTAYQQRDRELDAYFREHGRLDGFSLHFQRRMERTLGLPWQMALMEDRLWINVFSGKEPSLTERVASKATARILDKVFSNIGSYIRFMRVAHMLDAPTKMLSPEMLGAMLSGSGGPPVEPPRVE